MAKSKKQGVGEPASTTAESGQTSTPVPAPEPSNESFKDLRQKIQAQFQKLDTKAVKNKSKTPKSTKPEKEKVDQAKAKESSTQLDRGKKRDRNGQVLKHDNKRASLADAPRQAAPASDGDGDVDDLQKEVLALGGTTEDLDLLADANSDSEMEGSVTEVSQKSQSKKSSEGLDKGLKNILKEIALASGELSDEQSNASESDLDDEPTAKGNPAQTTDAKGSQKTPRGKQSQYVCQPRPDWYNIPDPVVDTETPPRHKLQPHTANEIYEYAKHLLDEENRKFTAEQGKSSSQSFYNTVIASGTLSDKISALTLAVQESPLHNVRALETLIGLARKRSRSQAVDVLRSLKDLFAQGSLLPESRKLYAFQAQPTLPYLFGRKNSWKRGDQLPKGLEEGHLAIWAFESWLKEQYFEVLKILEVWCNDEIEFSKSKAVSFVYELLKERPEQESNLLRLLINKLGDPVKKIASQASYLLMQLLIAHPAMKSVVVSAIESDFIFKPGQSLHGKYYAVVTINQTALSSKEESVAIKLLDIYFGLFTWLLKPQVRVAPTDERETVAKEDTKSKPNQASGQPQADELREKLTSAILTGVNRAYPYAESSTKGFSDHLETLFKITHSSNFNTSIQAMLLIQQLATQHKASNDRFYRVLYESLLDPRLLVASKQQLYLNLLHRALKADLNVKRVKAFVKRLVQVLSLHDPPFIVGAFFLLQDLERTFPGLANLVDETEDHDDDEENFRDVDEDAQEGTTDGADAAKGNHYDGHKRAPEHANADNSCAWEILPFLAHFHPSVSLSADHVLRHARLPGKADLSLHTLSHFLDRFVYRNAKLSSSGLRGTSIMQPMAASETQNVLIGNNEGAQRRIPVNSEQFRIKKDGEVAAEDAFFHQYFNSLGKASTKKGKTDKKRAGDDEESVDEDEVWKAMMDSAPDLEGEEEDEDDIDLSELESELDGDDGEVVSDSDGEGVDIDPSFFEESEDDLMQVDATGGDDMGDFAGFESADEMDEPAKKKQSRKEEKKKERKAKKSLPTFASVEDYAKMLEDDGDEDVGTG